MANDAEDRPDDEVSDDDYVDEHDDEYDDDEYDDEYDDDEYYDDDDDEPAPVDPAAAAKKRRDTYLVIGAAAIILIAVLFIVVKGGNTKNSNDTGSGATATTAAGPTTSSGPIQKHWPDDAVNHPPKGFTGSGDPDKSGNIKPGVYWWSSYDGWHVRLVRGPGVQSANIDILGVDPNPVTAKKLSTGVTATNSGKSHLVLVIPPGSDPIASADLDVNGFNDKMTWTFDGVPVTSVYMGSSLNPISASPYTIQKQ